MFDISALKNMKLSELQEIAKLAKTIKFAGVKKEDLITQILEQQASSSVEVNTSEEVNADKPKRVRILPAKKGTIQAVSTDNEMVSNSLSEDTTSTPTEAAENKGPKVVKFNKSAYEQKIAKKESTSGNEGDQELPLDSSDNEEVSKTPVHNKKVQEE
jgi:transcription termination factor Rho